MKKLLLFCLAVVLVSGGVVTAQEGGAAGPLIPYDGQELFLNGINLAWINFGRDLRDFDEIRFVAALDELAAANGNTLRWWLHTEGSTSPVYGDDGMVVGLGENDLVSLRRALDLAYERGILLMLTLWSHDMMNEREGIPTEWNRLMIEDPAYTQAYINNALVPMVEAVAGHPGIAAWEIFNEPEGTTETFGWTDVRTTMPAIQQFVNLLAGAIHRADPDTPVTNGSWNMQVLTDIEGMTNYYTDERLIAAGGDPDGTLDFYQVHYYPEYFDETTSPFHNSYAHWALDKPLVVGEFPATAIADLGMGFRPDSELSDSMVSYEYLYENGYAGALSWMFYASDHGSMAEAAPGIHRVGDLAPEHVQVDVGDIDHIPAILTMIENAVLPNTTAAVEGYVDLDDIFSDVEDATLAYAVTENTRPDLVEVVIDENAVLSLTIAEGEIGTSLVAVTATDSAGNFSRVPFVVQVIDPNRGNVALGKTAYASTTENVGHLAEYAVDGLDDTRWSSEYADEQWLGVDLGDVFTINQVVLRWEVAYGAHYEIQVWDGETWQTIVEEQASDGQIDDLVLEESIDARYVRMNGILRATEWGFSLWEFEVNGALAEAADPALAGEPELFTLAAEAAAAAAAAAAADTEEPPLHSFDEDVEGFALADYWSGGTAVEVVDGALAVTAAFSGSEWMEAGVFLQPVGGVDWTAYDRLAVDVFVPEGASGFLAQIFIKTGPDWAWANTADAALTPGEWTTVTAELDGMGDLGVVMEYGVKVGTSVTAFEGDILIDNITLAE